MERNWYVICTLPNRERKVSTLLTKKGIENFCPVTSCEKKLSASKSISTEGPLFKSYIFVNIDATEIQAVKKMPYVVNTLYWQSKPAVINQDEINAVKMMTENYTCIKIERTGVKANERISIVEKNITGYNNKTVTIQHQGVLVKLPTLGCTLSALRSNRTDEVLVKKKKESPGFIPRALNSIFLFNF
jgi:transcription antitermination factor NusG